MTYVVVWIIHRVGRRKHRSRYLAVLCFRMLCSLIILLSKSFKPCLNNLNCNSHVAILCNSHPLLFDNLIAIGYTYSYYFQALWSIPLRGPQGSGLQGPKCFVMKLDAMLLLHLFSQMFFMFLAFLAWFGFVSTFQISSASPRSRCVSAQLTEVWTWTSRTRIVLGSAA